ncbi:MAG: hypothetical protein QME25_02425 [Bacteroidota bacterium]|nr:hypothetical protein [Bacteroidota bacterium]
MTNQIVAGVSVEGDSTQFVVLKSGELKTELFFIEEYKRTDYDKSETWFLKPLTTHSSKLTEKCKVVSVALDKKIVFTHTFPMDSMLTRDQQNEHLNWELSQLLPNFHPQDYISDMHVLQVHPDKKTNDILSVSVKRSLVYAIHDYIHTSSLNLNIIDATQFAAEGALLYNHPEILTQECVLVGLSQTHTEFSHYSNGHLTDYNFRQEANLEFIARFLHVFIKDKNIKDIFIHGPNADIGTLKTLRTGTSLNVQILNPFKRITHSLSVRNFDKFATSLQRFAPAVGIALRKP